MFCFVIASAPDLCQTMENLSVQDDLAKQVSKYVSWYSIITPSYMFFPE